MTEIASLLWRYEFLGLFGIPMDTDKWVGSSVARLDELSQFWLLFKVCVHSCLAQNDWQIFKGVKILYFSSENCLGNFRRLFKDIGELFTRTIWSPCNVCLLFWAAKLEMSQTYLGSKARKINIFGWLTWLLSVHCGPQCDQIIEWKIAQTLPKSCQKVATTVWTKNDVFQSSPKRDEIFGLFLLPTKFVPDNYQKSANLVTLIVAVISTRCKTELKTKFWKITSTNSRNLVRGR